MTKEKLAQLKAQVLSNAEVKKADIEELIAVTERQYTVISEWYNLLQLIARSGSSWSGRVKEALNNYLLGTTDQVTIDNVKSLLQQHRGETVDSLLDTLNRLDTPLNRTSSSWSSRSRY